MKIFQYDFFYDIFKNLITGVIPAQKKNRAKYVLSGVFPDYLQVVMFMKN